MRKRRPIPELPGKSPAERMASYPQFWSTSKKGGLFPLRVPRGSLKKFSSTGAPRTQNPNRSPVPAALASVPRSQASSGSVAPSAGTLG